MVLEATCRHCDDKCSTMQKKGGLWPLTSEYLLGGTVPCTKSYEQVLEVQPRLFLYPYAISLGAARLIVFSEHRSEVSYLLGNLRTHKNVTGGNSKGVAHVESGKNMHRRA